MRVTSLLFVLLAVNYGTLTAQDNLALNRPVIVSSEYNTTYVAANAVDGWVADASRWLSAASAESWIKIVLDSVTVLGGIHLYSGYDGTDAIEDFRVEFADSGTWRQIPSAVVTGNTAIGVSIPFDAAVTVVTDTVRVIITRTKSDIARIHEITVWGYSATGIPVLGTGVTGYRPAVPDTLPLIYVNQSGYNLNKPKRFSAPTLADGTPFEIMEEDGNTVLYAGTITDSIGDFSDFNPESDRNFVISAGGEHSFPFRIGQWWLERGTYQNAVDFMIDSRHYTGNYTAKCSQSYGWRDDTHFGWELHTLVPQFLSNPSAYLRMPHQVTYQAPADTTLWGALEPYNELAPDIVKLIHWGADIIITQGLTHENLKAQLAYFLYAWPYISRWLPQQNYDVVREFTFSKWAVNTADRTYSYNESVGHNMLALKTKIGSTKGALPPGAGVLPNLLMYEVAKREQRADSSDYFDAAYNQVAWMISDLDWNDPQTTKGQRMSEHLTMTGLALMLQDYPGKAPAGLKNKIEEWAAVMIRRSDNMWDFRKLDDSTGWVPTGDQATQWNEPGNVIGFPGCILSMLQFIDDPATENRLLELAYAHMDNSFGRNPCGRHFSYDGPGQVEGVDVGWYSYYNGGIGQLSGARFVFDGGPKQEHYPYHPELGNIGWTEGWVQFNVAYNLSLAYMARNDIDITVEGAAIRLKVPMNFNYGIVESAAVVITGSNGSTRELTLLEESVNSEYFTGTYDSLAPGDTMTVSYGYGYFKKSAPMVYGSVPVKNELQPLKTGLSLYGAVPGASGKDIRILFSLPETGYTRLEIHDISGQSVALLLNETSPGGKHEAVWQRSGTAAGIYFVTLEQSGKRIQSKLVMR